MIGWFSGDGGLLGSCIRSGLGHLECMSWLKCRARSECTARPKCSSDACAFASCALMHLHSLLRGSLARESQQRTTSPPLVPKCRFSRATPRYVRHGCTILYYADFERSRSARMRGFADEHASNFLVRGGWYLKAYLGTVAITFIPDPN